MTLCRYLAAGSRPCGRRGRYNGATDWERRARRSEDHGHRGGGGTRICAAGQGEGVHRSRARRDRTRRGGPRGGRQQLPQGGGADAVGQGRGRGVHGRRRLALEGRQGREGPPLGEGPLFQRLRGLREGQLADNRERVLQVRGRAPRRQRLVPRGEARVLRGPLGGGSSGGVPVRGGAAGRHGAGRAGRRGGRCAQGGLPRHTRERPRGQVQAAGLRGPQQVEGGRLCG